MIWDTTSKYSAIETSIKLLTNLFEELDKEFGGLLGIYEDHGLTR